MLVNRDQLIRIIERTYPFSLASDQEVYRLAVSADVVFFEAGKVIFQEGASARYIYLIIEGAVEILKEEKQQLKMLNQLSPEMIFGEDTICTNHGRRSSARAQKDTILIRLEKPLIDTTFSGNDEIRKAIDLLAISYEMLIGKHQLMLSENEAIHYMGRPHYFFFIVKSLTSLTLYTLLSGVGVFLFLNRIISAATLIWTISIITSLFLLFVVWRYIEWRNDHYIFTNKRVICEDRVMLLHDFRFEIPLGAIVNLNIRKNFFGRKFSFGDLSIKTFTGLNRLKHVHEVDIISRLLEFLWKKDRIDFRKGEQKAFEWAIKNQSVPDDEQLILLTDDIPRENEQPGGLAASFINRFLKLQIQKDDSIIYHTHWIILIRKTVFPAFLMFSALMLYIYLSVNKFSLVENRSFVFFIFITLAVCLVWWVYQYADWRRDQYIITPEQIMDVNRRPFGTEDLRTAPIKNIQSIRYKRSGLLGLLLNFGTVFIRVGDDELTFDQVYDPAAIQQVLFLSLEKYLSEQKRTDLTEQQQHMADWISSYLESEKQN